MWLYWVSAILLCAQSSCGLLGGGSLPHRSDIGRPDDDEGAAEGYAFMAQIGGVVSNIVSQIEAYHDHISNRMDKLEASCNMAHSKPLPGIEYQVPTQGSIKPVATTPPSVSYEEPDGFQDARMNFLIKEMTREMTGIADVFLDDMLLVTENITLAISERLERSYPPSEGNFGDLHDLIEALAKKETVNQIKIDVGSFVTSSIAEVREHMRKMASKSELATATNDLVSRVKHLEEATQTMDDCAESTQLVKEALPKVTESTGKIADMKARWLRASAASTCPDVPQRLLSSLELAAKEGRDSVMELSQTLEETEDEVSTHMEELTLILQVALQLQNTTTLPPPPTQEPFQSRLSPTTRRPVIQSPTTRQPTQTGIEGTPDEAACLDSTFTSRLTTRFSAPDICDSAVRLQNCQAEMVAFHCCRTCRNAGYVYPVPNIVASRQVPLLEALRFVMPTLRDMRSHSSNPFLRKASDVHSTIYGSFKG